MALHRIFHGFMRYVACGGLSGEDDSMDEEVEIEIEVGSVADAESRGLEPLPRLDSLERGYQSVMQRALTFAHKWSQPDLRKRLLLSSYPSSSSSTSQADSESDSEPGNGVSLEVTRDSSQARFEQLMQRTSRFYERCSMLQQQRALLLHNGCNVPSY